MPAALLDTNILLYAISSSPDEAGKRQVARELLSGADWGLSIQVLQEFYVNATRGATPAMSHALAEAAIRQFLLRPLAINDAALMLNALDLKQRYQLSFWDAAILAAAQALGASVVYSEDLNHGQDYAGVRVVNPFLKA
ncbi:MAG: PIN domain-containing protein [Gammaproteobacteria bacterium]|nr:PIN domain-containing protein [Gammaproteobacteria bacterium]